MINKLHEPRRGEQQNHSENVSDGESRFKCGFKETNNILQN